MHKYTPALAAVLVAVVATGGLAARGRDYIAIVGSSTVYPFAAAVAEQFGKTSRFKTPKIEATGTGGGFKLFCAGAGVDTPDIANASRRIKRSEFETCAKNGVTEIVEVKVGFDGIVVASSKKSGRLNLSRKDLYLALAREVPGPDDGRLAANPYTTWKEVNPSLPADRIEVLGPPPTSGTRDAFIELVMEAGCVAFPSIRELEKTDEQRFKAVCQAIREDGAFVEAGENDNLIVQKLEANPRSLGIFGFSFLEQNADRIQGAIIDGQAPTFDNIAAGNYPVSRPLFIYVKKAHVGAIPGIPEYIAEFTSERAWGEEGYLAEKGLIPSPKNERTAIAAEAKAMNSVNSSLL